MSVNERELLAKCITAQCAAMQTKRATVEMHTDAAEEAEGEKPKSSYKSGY